MALPKSEGPLSLFPRPDYDEKNNDDDIGWIAC